MNVLEQVRSWLGIDPAPAPPPRVSAVRQSMDAALRAKRAEDYAQAVAALDRAMALAQENRDFTAMSAVALQKSEALILQENWAEAETLLTGVRQRAQQNNQKAQVAYTLNMLGMLAQAQGNWDGARQYYEQALNAARTVGAVAVEGRALGHLSDTYLRENNATYAAHLLREALPKLSASSEIDVSVYFIGLLGQALIQIGQEAEGIQLLNRAFRLAKQINDQRHERHWALVLGERTLAEARYREAYGYYEQALRLFRSPTATPEYITALCQMGKACLALDNTDEALRYAREAETLSSGLGADEIHAMVECALGMALHARGRSAEAIAHLEVAAEGYQKLGRGEQEIELLRTLGAALANNGDDARAIAIYQQAAQRAEALGARLELADARRDLGLLFAQRKELPMAMQEWTAALAIYQAQKLHAHVARLYCDIAGARRQLGQGQRSIKDYEHALMALNLLRDDPDTRGLVLSNAANAYVDQGDVESANAFFNEAIQLAERTGDEAAESTRRSNYGWFLVATGRPRQAIASLEQALRLSQMLKLDLQTAVQTDNLGLAYDALGDPTRALGYHQRALELIKSLGHPHWETLFNINQANTLLAMGQIGSAVALFEDGLAQSRSSENLEGVIQALIGLAQAHLERKQPQEAETALGEAVALARKADRRRLLAEALSAHSRQQAEVNNPERSLALWEEARKLFNILQNPKAKTEPAWLKDAPLAAS